MGPADPPAHRLPPVDVDVDAALDRTRTRGARRQRRRAAVLAAGAIAVVVLLAAVAVAAGRDDGEGVIADAPTTTTTPPAPEGDPSLWHVVPDDLPDPDASRFTVLVARLGCNDGETGEVSGVRTVETAEFVTVTIAVTPAEPGPHTCPGNEEVRHDVQLEAPIGDRMLRDGTCSLDPRIAAGDCVADDGTAFGRYDDVRWPEDAVLEPRECEAPEGSPIDVAHEPDTRRYADWSTVTDTDLCIVRIDFVSERSGSDHCGFDVVQVLITGDPFGTSQEEGRGSKYIRDPEGAFGDPELTAGFQTDADLPPGAEPTGFFLEGHRAIWIDPEDPSAVYVFTEDTTIERWPRGQELICN